MSFLALLSTTSSFEDKYIQSIKALDIFAGNLESISPIQNSYSHSHDAEMVLLQGKQLVIAWPNTIAPESREVPVGIVHWNPQLQLVITELQGFAQQPRPLSDLVKKGIVSAANSALNILLQTSGEISSLSSGLKQLATDLQNHNQALISLLHQIDQDISSYRQRLAAFYGYLHQLESASKPDKGRINAVAVQIQETQNQLAGASNWNLLLSQIIQDEEQAVPSAQHLMAYWSEFASDLAHIMDMLRQMRQNPAQIIFSLELAEVEKSWRMTYQRMTQIAQAFS